MADTYHTRETTHRHRHKPHTRKPRQDGEPVTLEWIDPPLTWEERKWLEWKAAIGELRRNPGRWARIKRETTTHPEEIEWLERQGLETRTEYHGGTSARLEAVFSGKAQPSDLYARAPREAE